MDRLRRVVLKCDRFGNHSFVVCGDGAQSLHGTTTEDEVVAPAGFWPWLPVSFRQPHQPQRVWNRRMKDVVPQKKKKNSKKTRSLHAISATTLKVTYNKCFTSY